MRILPSDTFGCVERVVANRASPPAYKTLKVLTAYASSQNRAGALQELAFLKATTKLASSPSPSPASSTTSLTRRNAGSSKKSVNVPQLDDSFEHPGPHGNHICFVFPKLYTTLSNVRKTLPDNHFQSGTVKVIVEGLLDGLDALHGAGIIHTGMFSYPSDGYQFYHAEVTAHRSQTKQHCFSQSSHILTNCQASCQVPVSDSRGFLS